ncbi:hypothetical protein CXG81DRAFT_14714, partial [Caulochytrium protostelioides]
RFSPPRVFEADELLPFDGSDPEKPIYIAIKGIVFDLSGNRKSYAPGGSYHVFAGKDPSMALGKSSLKPEECVADFSSLDAEQMKVLDQWLAFFTKRYPRVGVIKGSYAALHNL